MSDASASVPGALIGGLRPAAVRQRVIEEVHARPFHPLQPPARLLHLAFLTDDAAKQADRAFFHAELVGDERQAEAETNPRRVEKNGIAIRWEQHTEFTTYTLEQPLEQAQADFSPESAAAMLARAGVRPPGEILVVADLCVIPARGFGEAEEALFDRASLAVSCVEDGQGVIVSDFRQQADGRIRFLVISGGMSEWQTGALVQRVLEHETYRTLALLGLVEAQRIAPQVRAIEQALAEQTQKMRAVERLEENNALLGNLTRLAADLEAQAVETSYRFGATRAYARICEMRLQAMREAPYGSYNSWHGFMNRRMAPAMRTCQTISERQADLSRKLARAANLLRTRVDVEIERQNRNLLRSMNTRSKLQLRLQQTVEGLSVVAISYYSVGLVGYLAKGGEGVGLPLAPYIITGLSVPVVLVLAWLLISRIRRHHMLAERADERAGRQHRPGEGS